MAAAEELYLVFTKVHRSDFNLDLEALFESFKEVVAYS